MKLFSKECIVEKIRIGNNIIAALSLLILFASIAAAQITPEKIKPLVPNSLEDKLSAADAVVLGTVQGIVPDPSKPGMENQSPRPMVAEVLVEKVFKGSIPPGNIKVGFAWSQRPTKPELVQLKRGEQAVMFLIRDSSGYQFIGPSYGKERPDVKLLKDLEKATKDKMLTFGVEAELAVAGLPAAGDSVGVLFVMENKGALTVVFCGVPDAVRDLIVVAPDGKVLQPLAESARKGAGGAKLVLGPGQFFGYRADLAKIFGVAQPGVYTVSAAFKSVDTCGTESWFGVVETKPVSVEVK